MLYWNCTLSHFWSGLRVQNYVYLWSCTPGRRKLLFSQPFLCEMFAKKDFVLMIINFDIHVQL